MLATSCPKRTGACLRLSMPIEPEDGSQASAKVMHQPLDKSKLRRTLQRQVGSPCPCSNNTMPSWPRTNLPSNSRSPPRNRTAPRWEQSVRPWHNRRLDSGNPFHELGSTTPSWAQTNPPANLQIHPRNCRDLLGVVVPSADRRYDDGCSTKSVWLHPNLGKIPPRNCTDRQALLVLEAAWVEGVVQEAESGAESRVEFAAAWVAAWVAVWETEWAGLSAWSPAKLWSRIHDPLLHNSSPSAPVTTTTLLSIPASLRNRHCNCTEGTSK